MKNLVTLGRFLRVTTSRSRLLPTINNHNRFYTTVPKTASTAAASEPPVVVNNKDENNNLLLNDVNLINHLERTSLVDFGNQEAILRLQEAIKFADVLFEVDTTKVEPLYSVLEQETLYLRPDQVADTSRTDVLLNAAVTDEDYIVAPPGNIPLEQRQS